MKIIYKEYNTKEPIVRITRNTVKEAESHMGIYINREWTFRCGSFIGYGGLNITKLMFDHYKKGFYI